MSQKIEGGLPAAGLAATAVVGARSATAGTGPAKPVDAVAAGDSLRLTGEAATLQAASREFSATQPVDQSKVQSIREALAAGTYKVDAKAIAGAMIDFEKGLGA